MSATKHQTEQQKIQIIMKTLNLQNHIVSYEQLLEEQTEYFEKTLPNEIAKLQKEVKNTTNDDFNRTKALENQLKSVNDKKSKAELKLQNLAATRAPKTQILLELEKAKNEISELKTVLDTIKNTYNQIPSVKYAQELKIKQERLRKYNNYKTSEDARVLQCHIKKVKSLIKAAPKDMLEEWKEYLNRLESPDYILALSLKKIPPSLLTSLKSDVLQSHIKNVQHLILKEKKAAPKKAKDEQKEHQDMLSEWEEYLTILKSPNHDLLLSSAKIPTSLNDKLEEDNSRTNADKANMESFFAQTSSSLLRLNEEVKKGLTDSNPSPGTDMSLTTATENNPAVFRARMIKVQMNITNRLHQAVKAHVAELFKTALEDGFSKADLDNAVNYCIGQLENGQKKDKALDVNQQETSERIIYKKGTVVVRMHDIYQSTYSAYVAEAKLIDSTKSLNKVDLGPELAPQFASTGISSSPTRENESASAPIMTPLFALQKQKNDTNKIKTQLTRDRTPLITDPTPSQPTHPRLQR